MKKKKILLLTNIISPYISDLFNHLSQFSEIDLTVKACAYTEPDRKWQLDFLKSPQYKYEIIKDAYMLKQPGKNRFFYFGGWSVISEILQNRYDLVIFKGGTRVIGPLAALAARFSNAQTVLWEQNSFYTTNTLLKKIVKKLYINDRIFDRFIAYGEQVKELILDFNPQAKVSTVLSPINNEKYRKNYFKYKRKRNLIKKKLGLKQDEKIILYIGRFVAEKNLFSLLTAAEKLKKTQKFPFKFVLVGGGDLEERLNARIGEMGLENEVKLVPFQGFDRLSMFYTIADMFILPSSFEPWGLVVNEAMNFNLPIVVSDRVGCAKSLVIDGYNGYVYSLHNEFEMTDKIVKAVNNSVKLGEKSAEKIKEVSFKQVCETLISLTKGEKTT